MAGGWADKLHRSRVPPCQKAEHRANLRQGAFSLATRQAVGQSSEKEGFPLATSQGLGQTSDTERFPLCHLTTIQKNSDFAGGANWWTHQCTDWSLSACSERGAVQRICCKARGRGQSGGRLGATPIGLLETVHSRVLELLALKAPTALALWSLWVHSARTLEHMESDNLVSSDPAEIRRSSTPNDPQTTSK